MLNTSDDDKRPLVPPRGWETERIEKPFKAQWMRSAELAKWRYETGGILLGSHDGEWIGTPASEDRHLLTVAGSRAGKSSTCLKPNCLLWPSSLLCIDPKGELAMATAEHRHKALGQEVYIFDPFEVVSGPAAAYRRPFNPLAELLAGRPEDVVDDAALVADALIVADKGGDQHWTMSAKNLVRGLLLFALHIKGDDASLSDVREMLQAPLELDNAQDDDTRATLSAYFKLMASHVDAFSGVLAGVGNTMSGKPRNERGSIISTAIEQMAFLDSEPMKAHLSGSSIPSLRVLKQRPCTIFLVLPASRMATHFRWFRLILTLALAALERENETAGGPVLFVLEEFPQLGYMRQIEAAAGLMAGYGVKLWTILQDLPQIQALYPSSWETFIGNAGVVQSFGNTDATTLEYLSKKLGDRQITEHTNEVAAPSQPRGRSQQNSRSIPLMAPFEVAYWTSRESGRQIVHLAGQEPSYIDRITHEEIAKID